MNMLSFDPDEGKPLSTPSPIQPLSPPPLIEADDAQRVEDPKTRSLTGLPLVGEGALQGDELYRAAEAPALWTPSHASQREGWSRLGARAWGPDRDIIEAPNLFVEAALEAAPRTLLTKWMESAPAFFPGSEWSWKLRAKGKEWQDRMVHPSVAAEVMRAKVIPAFINDPLYPWYRVDKWQWDHLDEMVVGWAAKIGEQTPMIIETRIAQKIGGFVVHGILKAAGLVAGGAAGFGAGVVTPIPIADEAVGLVGGMAAGYLVGEYIASSIPMIALEASAFLDEAERVGLPRDIAARYAREYGVKSGLVESAQSLMTLGLFKKAGGTSRAPGRMAMGKIMKFLHIGGVSETIEGTEEVAQQLIQDSLMKEAIEEARKVDGWKPTSEYMQATGRDLVEQFFLGALTAATFRGLGVADDIVRRQWVLGMPKMAQRDKIMKELGPTYQMHHGVVFMRAVIDRIAEFLRVEVPKDVELGPNMWQRLWGKNKNINPEVTTTELDEDRNRVKRRFLDVRPGTASATFDQIFARRQRGQLSHRAIIKIINEGGTAQQQREKIAQLLQGETGTIVMEDEGRARHVFEVMRLQRKAAKKGASPEINSLMERESRGLMGIGYSTIYQTRTRMKHGSSLMPMSATLTKDGYLRTLDPAQENDWLREFVRNNPAALSVTMAEWKDLRQDTRVPMMAPHMIMGFRPEQHLDLIGQDEYDELVRMGYNPADPAGEINPHSMELHDRLTKSARLLEEVLDEDRAASMGTRAVAMALAEIRGEDLQAQWDTDPGAAAETERLLIEYLTEARAAMTERLDNEAMAYVMSTLKYDHRDTIDFLLSHVQLLRATLKDSKFEKVLPLIPAVAIEGTKQDWESFDHGEVTHQVPSEIRNGVPIWRKPLGAFNSVKFVDRWGRERSSVMQNQTTRIDNIGEDSIEVSVREKFRMLADRELPYEERYAIAQGILTMADWAKQTVAQIHAHLESINDHEQNDRRVEGAWTQETNRLRRIEMLLTLLDRTMRDYHAMQAEAVRNPNEAGNPLWSEEMKTVIRDFARIKQQLEREKDGKPGVAANEPGGPITDQDLEDYFFQIRGVNASLQGGDFVTRDISMLVALFDGIDVKSIPVTVEYLIRGEVLLPQDIAEEAALINAHHDPAEAHARVMKRAHERRARFIGAMIEMYAKAHWFSTLGMAQGIGAPETAAMWSLVTTPHDSSPGGLYFRQKVTDVMLGPALRATLQQIGMTPIVKTRSNNTVRGAFDRSDEFDPYFYFGKYVPPAERDEVEAPPPDTIRPDETEVPANDPGMVGHDAEVAAAQPDELIAPDSAADEMPEDPVPEIPDDYFPQGSEGTWEEGSDEVAPNQPDSEVAPPPQADETAAAKPAKKPASSPPPSTPPPAAPPAEAPVSTPAPEEAPTVTPEEDPKMVAYRAWRAWAATDPKDIEFENKRQALWEKAPKDSDGRLILDTPEALELVKVRDEQLDYHATQPLYQAWMKLENPPVSPSTASMVAATTKKKRTKKAKAKKAKAALQMELGLFPDSGASLVVNAVEDGIARLGFSWHAQFAAIPDRIRKQQSLAQQLQRIQVPKAVAAQFLAWAADKTGDPVALLEQYEATVLPPLEIAMIGPGWGQPYSRMSVNKGIGEYRDFIIRLPFDVPGQHGQFVDENIGSWFRARLVTEAPFFPPAIDRYEAREMTRGPDAGEWSIWDKDDGRFINRGVFWNETQAREYAKKLNGRDLTQEQRDRYARQIYPYVEVQEVQTAMATLFEFADWSDKTKTLANIDAALAKLRERLAAELSALAPAGLTRATENRIHNVEKARAQAVGFDAPWAWRGPNNETFLMNALGQDKTHEEVFINAIVQWAKERGYRSVRFPTGDTAARVEGHELISDHLKKLNEEREKAVIAEARGAKPKWLLAITSGDILLKNGGLFDTEEEALKEKARLFDEAVQNTTPDALLAASYEVYGPDMAAFYLSRNEFGGITRSVASIDEEIHRYKTEGLDKLAPVQAFYEQRVASIVKRMNAVPETDPSGNTWRTVPIHDALLGLDPGLDVDLLSNSGASVIDDILRYEARHPTETIQTLGPIEFWRSTSGGQRGQFQMRVRLYPLTMPTTATFMHLKRKNRDAYYAKFGKESLEAYSASFKGKPLPSTEAGRIALAEEAAAEQVAVMEEFGLTCLVERVIRHRVTGKWRSKWTILDKIGNTWVEYAERLNVPSTTVSGDISRIGGELAPTKRQLATLRRQFYETLGKINDDAFLASAPVELTAWITARSKAEMEGITEKHPIVEAVEKKLKIDANLRAFAAKVGINLLNLEDLTNDMRLRMALVGKGANFKVTIPSAESVVLATYEAVTGAMAVDREAVRGTSRIEPEPKAQTTTRRRVRVISGGQTGGDMGGLEAARDLGLETGGTAPHNFETEQGRNPDLLKSFGLVAGEADPQIYPRRTMKNVDDADVTIAFMWGRSVGTSKTVGYAQTGQWVAGDMSSTAEAKHRPVLVVTSKNAEEAAAQITAFLDKHAPNNEDLLTINVAGHREGSQPGIQAFVRKTMTMALRGSETTPVSAPLNIDYLKQQEIPGKDIIYFSRYYEVEPWLSNFETDGEELDLVDDMGIHYETVEAMYQAGKTLDKATREEISKKGPQAARKHGRSSRITLRPGWNEGVQYEVMLAALRQKFANPSLRKKLLATGTKQLVENTDAWKDETWGVANGKGANALGKLLMLVRAELGGTPVNQTVLAPATQTKDLTAIVERVTSGMGMSYSEKEYRESLPKDLSEEDQVEAVRAYGQWLMENHSEARRDANWKQDVAEGHITKDEDGEWYVDGLHPSAGGKGGHVYAYKQYYAKRYQYGQMLERKYGKPGTARKTTNQRAFSPLEALTYDIFDDRGTVGAAYTTEETGEQTYKVRIGGNGFDARFIQRTFHLEKGVEGIADKVIGYMGTITRFASQMGYQWFVNMDIDGKPVVLWLRHLTDPHFPSASTLVSHLRKELRIFAPEFAGQGRAAAAMAKQDRGVLERELNMRWMSMLQTMLQEQIEEDQNLALVRLTRLPKSATAGVRANAARRRKLAGKEPFVEPGRTDVPVVEGATSGFSMRPQTEQAGNEDRALIEDADDIRARMPSTEDEMTPLVSERSMFSTFWQLEGMESFVALDRWVGFKRDKRQDPGPVMAIHSLIRTVVRYWAQSSGYGAKPITLDPIFQFAGKNKELKEGGMLPVEVLIRKLNEAGISTATSAHSPEVADYMTAALYATVGHYLSVMVGGNIDEVMLGMLDATNTPSDRKRAVLVQMLADTASEQQQKVVKRMTDVEVGVAVVLKEIAEANPFLADLFPTILQDLRTAFYDSVREQGNAILEEVILFDFGSIARMKILEAFGWSVVAKDVVDEGIFDAEAIMEQTHMGKVMRPDIQIRAAQLAMGRLQAARMDEMDGVTVHKSSSRYERTGISPLKQEKNKQLDEMGDTTREALDDEDLDDKPNEFGLTPAQVAELDKVGAVQPGLWTRGLSFLSDHGINLAVLEDHLVSLKREIHATRTTASRRAIAKDDMLRVKQMLEDYIDQGKAHGIESGNENDMRELMKQLGWEDVLDSGQDDRHMAQLEVFAEMPDEEMLFDPDTFSPSYEVMDFRAAQPSSRATVINTTVVGVTDNAVAQMMREIRPGTVLIPAGYQLMGNMRSPIIEAMKEADGVLFVQADAHQDRTTGGGMLDWMNEVLHYGPQTMNPGDRIRMRKIGWSDKYHIGQVVPDERSLMNNTSVAVPLVASPNPLSGPARAVFTIDLSQPWSFDPRALATTFNRWLQKNGVRNLVIASTLAPTHATANKILTEQVMPQLVAGMDPNYRAPDAPESGVAAWTSAIPSPMGGIYDQIAAQIIEDIGASGILPLLDLGQAAFALDGARADHLDGITHGRTVVMDNGQTIYQTPAQALRDRFLRRFVTFAYDLATKGRHQKWRDRGAILNVAQMLAALEGEPATWHGDAVHVVSRMPTGMDEFASPVSVDDWFISSLLEGNPPVAFPLSESAHNEMIEKGKGKLLYGVMMPDGGRRYFLMKVDRAAYIDLDKRNLYMGEWPVGKKEDGTPETAEDAYVTRAFLNRYRAQHKEMEAQNDGIRFVRVLDVQDLGARPSVKSVGQQFRANLAFVTPDVPGIYRIAQSTKPETGDPVEVAHVIVAVLASGRRLVLHSEGGADLNSISGVLKRADNGVRKFFHDNFERVQPNGEPLDTSKLDPAIVTMIFNRIASASHLDNTDFAVPPMRYLMDHLKNSVYENPPTVRMLSDLEAAEWSLIMPINLSRGFQQLAEERVLEVLTRSGMTRIRQPNESDDAMTFEMGAKDNITGEDISTFDLILAGKRTASTRHWHGTYKAGDVKRFISADGRVLWVVVTGMSDTLENELRGWRSEFKGNETKAKAAMLEELAEPEGWTVDAFTRHYNEGRVVNGRSRQLRFQLLKQLEMVGIPQESFDAYLVEDPGVDRFRAMEQEGNLSPSTIERVLVKDTETLKPKSEAAQLARTAIRKGGITAAVAIRQGIVLQRAIRAASRTDSTRPIQQVMGDIVGDRELVERVLEASAFADDPKIDGVKVHVPQGSDFEQAALAAWAAVHPGQKVPKFGSAAMQKEFLPGRLEEIKALSAWSKLNAGERLAALFGHMPVDLSNTTWTAIAAWMNKTGKLTALTLYNRWIGKMAGIAQAAAKHLDRQAENATAQVKALHLIQTLQRDITPVFMQILTTAGFKPSGPDPADSAKDVQPPDGGASLIDTGPLTRMTFGEMTAGRFMGFRALQRASRLETTQRVLLSRVIDRFRQCEQVAPDIGLMEALSYAQEYKDSEERPWMPLSTLLPYAERAGKNSWAARKIKEGIDGLITRDLIAEGRGRTLASLSATDYRAMSDAKMKVLDDIWMEAPRAQLADGTADFVEGRETVSKLAMLDPYKCISIRDVFAEYDLRLQAARKVSDNFKTVNKAAALREAARVWHENTRSLANKEAEAFTDGEWISQFPQYVSHKDIWVQKKREHGIVPTRAQAEFHRAFDRIIDGFRRGNRLRPGVARIDNRMDSYSRDIWEIYKRRHVFQVLGSTTDVDGQPSVIPVFDANDPQAVDRAVFPAAMRRAIGSRLQELILADRFGAGTSHRRINMREVLAGGQSLSIPIEAQDNPVALNRDLGILTEQFNPKARGYTLMTLQGYQGVKNIWVHPEVVPIVEHLTFVPDAKGWKKSWTNLAHTMKQIALSFSLFHDFSITESLIMGLGIRWNNPGLLMLAGIFPYFIWRNTKLKRYMAAVREGMDNPDGTYQKWAMRGLGLGNLGYDDPYIGAFDPSEKASGRPDIINSALERNMDKLRKSMAGRVVNRTILKPLLGLKKWTDRELWGFYHPAVMLYMADHVLAERMKNDPNVDPDQAMDEIAQWVNDSVGGQEWSQYVWANPKTRQHLAMLWFAHDWSISTLNQSALSNLPAFQPVFNRMNPWVADRIEHTVWPAMFGMVMLGIPIATQAMITLAAGAMGFGDEDDEIWMWMNEEGKRTYVDFTPLARMIPGMRNWTAKSDTKERRLYLRWAKQAWEVFDGWLVNPFKTAFSKTSQPVKLAFELLTGYDTMGRPNVTRESGIEIGEKIRRFPGEVIVPKFAPMSIWSLVEGRPSTFFAPASTGTGFSRTVERMEDEFKRYADPDFADRLVRQRWERNLSTLVDAEIDAASRNGVDPWEAMEQAKTHVLSDLYTDFFEAWNKGSDSNMERKAEAIVRMGGTLQKFMISMKNRMEQRHMTASEFERPTAPQEEFRKAEQALRGVHSRVLPKASTTGRRAFMKERAEMGIPLSPDLPTGKPPPRSQF